MNSLLERSVKLPVMTSLMNAINRKHYRAAAISYFAIVAPRMVRLKFKADFARRLEAHSYSPMITMFAGRHIKVPDVASLVIELTQIKDGRIVAGCLLFSLQRIDPDKTAQISAYIQRKDDQLHLKLTRMIGMWRNLDFMYRIFGDHRQILNIKQQKGTERP